MTDRNRNRGQQNQDLNVGRYQQQGSRSNREMETEQNVSNLPGQQNQRSGLGSSSNENLGTRRDIDRRESITE